MNYLDFELHVDAGTASTYPITILQAPAGMSAATSGITVDDVLLDVLDKPPPLSRAACVQAINGFGQATGHVALGSSAPRWHQRIDRWPSARFWGGLPYLLAFEQWTG